MTEKRKDERTAELYILHSGYGAQDMARMREAIDAVCGELGISRGPAAARDAVARRVVAAYDKGRRQPLNLVHAGLSAELCA